MTTDKFDPETTVKVFLAAAGLEPDEGELATLVQAYPALQGGDRVALCDPGGRATRRRP